MKKRWTCKAAGRVGGKAKVKKGFAVRPPSKEAREKAWKTRRGRNENA
jgi:hypothetical protein